MLTARRAGHRHDAASGYPDSPFSSIDFSRGALVAVSGGSDSTALLLLLKQYLDRSAPAAPLLAVTVDHDLRANSAAEAKAVGRLCADFGITHRTLVWTGAKPSTGLPAAAREARYRLLAQAAREAGIDVIVTGHTADDQAETVIMRRLRTNAGGRGLAGMAPATLYDWTSWIVRPLLGARRAELREFLRGEDIGWIDDPTNEDDTFERPRIRAELDRRRDERQVIETLALAARQAAQRQNGSRGAANLLRAFATRPTAGLVRLDPQFTAADRDAVVTALRILLATVGGVSFPPDEARTAALAQRLAGGWTRATLSRTVVDARRSGIFLHRELRGLPATTPAVDGAIWDGRHRIAPHDRHGRFLISPAGVSPAGPGKIGDTHAPDDVAPAVLGRAAAAAEPAFRHADAGTRPSEADMAAVSSSPVVSPFARFLPSFDLDLAEAVAGLVGAPAPPASPLRG